MNADISPIGPWYDTCPYCGNQSELRDSRGGCPGCGAPRPCGARAYRDYEVKVCSTQLDWRRIRADIRTELTRDDD